MNKFATARIPFIALLIIFLASSWSCHTGTGTQYQNIPPKTRLANIPPNGFVSDNPRLTLYWVGDDPDGYVVGFRYTWTFRLGAGLPFEKKPYSTILNIGIDKSGGEKFALMTNASPAQLPAVYKYFATLPPEGIAPDSSNKIDAGDSLIIEGAHVWASNPSNVRFPVHVNPNSGTFIFDSQDTLNPHTFEVAAIDNVGEVDPNPPLLNFETPQVPPPHSQIVDGPADTVLVRIDATDTFTGVKFTFQGFDPNSRTIDYSWVVDKNVWVASGRPIPWSEFNQNTTAFITAGAFPPESVFAVKHTLYLRTRNEFGSIDTLGYYTVGADTVFARRDFFTIYPLFLRPNFEPRTLLLNASFNYKDSTGVIYPNSDTLDNFYTSILDAIGRNGKYDVAHATKIPAYFPGLGVLGKYSTLLFVGDVIHFTSFLTEVPKGNLPDYVSIGGKMVISAYDMRLVYQSETFMKYVPHCQDNEPRSNYAFIGATGDKGYPDVALDYAKIDTAWYYHDPANPGFHNPLGLFFVYAGRPSGFGEIIYRFHDNGVLAPADLSFEGRTVGVRYIGLTYQVIYFGFPLYYCEKPTVVQMISRAFQDIGY